MAIDYTEVATGSVQLEDSEEGIPSSFRKTEARVKSLFPWMRSYMFRRRLSFVAVFTAFVAAGVTFTFVMMKNHGNAPHFGK
jgi:hypothetical protein